MYAIVYLTLLVNPSLLPTQMAEVMNSLKGAMPKTYYDASLVTGTVLGGGLTVSGARRIANEPLPLAKVYDREWWKGVVKK